MPRVFVGNVVFESMEDYLAALNTWEELRAPFKAQAEALTEEFVHYLSEQGLSKRTISKHRQNVEIFVIYLTQYTDADDFASVGKGIVNTDFFRWYRRKVLNRCDPAALKSSTLKFFKFLAERKGIYNERVLGKRGQ